MINMLLGRSSEKVKMYAQWLKKVIEGCWHGYHEILVQECSHFQTLQTTLEGFHNVLKEVSETLGKAVRWFARLYFLPTVFAIYKGSHNYNHLLC